eukprot:Amastigsp_a677402_17.p4 type:complete len:172 gc:universal Amastigsp_a677402_17:869-354(-)
MELPCTCAHRGDGHDCAPRVAAAAAALVRDVCDRPCCTLCEVTSRHATPALFVPAQAVHGCVRLGGHSLDHRAADLCARAPFTVPRVVACPYGSRNVCLDSVLCRAGARWQRHRRGVHRRRASNVSSTRLTASRLMHRDCSNANATMRMQQCDCNRELHAMRARRPRVSAK